MMEMDDKKILIVDDDRDFRDSLCEILELEEYQAFPVRTKEEGLEALRIQKPHVALVDLHLGHSNGIEVIQDFKQYDPDIICLVVTAHLDVDSALDAVKNGAYDYLRKPLGGEELLAAMDRCFELIKLEQGNKAAEQSILIQNRELEEINKRLKYTVISSARFSEQNEYYELLFSIREEYQRLFPGSTARLFMISQFDRQISEMLLETKESRELDDRYGDPLQMESLLQGEPLVIDDLQKAALSPSFLGYQSGALLIVPLTGKDFKTMGYVSLHKTETGGFTRYDSDLANILSSVSSSSLRSLITNEELKEAEYRYRQSQKLEALGRLAGGIAHDFNNLLSAILGYTELLHLDLEGDDEARNKLSEIRKVVHHGSSLISQLLTFSRRDNHTKKAINVNSLLKETSKILKILLGVENHLILDLHEGPCTVLGDADQIKQVLLNLVINARDAMEGYGSELKITTRISQLNRYDLQSQNDVEPGTYLELCVSDAGSGMDEETLSHIFDPFFTTKESGKGTGLGLSTVFGIIHQAKGHIAIDSRPGRGSDFRIYLPLFESEPLVETIPPEQNSPEMMNHRILLVEDDTRIRSVIRDSLQRRGLQVSVAEDGVQGLALFRKEPLSFDLIITDVMMPRMRGDRFAEEVLDIKSSQKLIYMSGYTTDSLFDNEKIKVDESNFLQKPFTNDALLNMVQALLS